MWGELASSARPGGVEPSFQKGQPNSSLNSRDQECWKLAICGFLGDCLVGSQSRAELTE